VVGFGAFDGRKLEHHCVLSWTQSSEQDDFAVGKLQGVVIDVRPMHIDLAELRHSLVLRQLWPPFQELLYPKLERFNACDLTSAKRFALPQLGFLGKLVLLRGHPQHRRRREVIAHLLCLRPRLFGAIAPKLRIVEVVRRWRGDLYLDSHCSTPQLLRKLLPDAVAIGLVHPLHGLEQAK
jgi:hypothetical protein